MRPEGTAELGSGSNPTSGFLGLAQVLPQAIVADEDVEEDNEPEPAVEEEIEEPVAQVKRGGRRAARAAQQALPVHTLFLMCALWQAQWMGLLCERWRGTPCTGQC